MRKREDEDRMKEGMKEREVLKKQKTRESEEEERRKR